MSHISQKPAVAPIPLFQQAYGSNPATSATPTSGTGFADNSFITYVGQKFETSDGRVVALVSNGAVALGSGVLVQASAEITGFELLAMTVPTAYPATAGLTQIYATNGSTVLKQNLFQGGYAVIGTGTGAGQTLKIASHQAAAANASFVITLEDPIVTTLDATSKVSLIQNPYANVVVNPTTQTGAPVGVTLYGLAASTAPTWNGTSGALTAAGTNQYGLIVTGGPTACLIDTLTNVGYPVGASTAVSGAVAVATLTHSAQVGISAQTQTSGDYGVIFLQL